MDHKERPIMKCKIKSIAGSCAIIAGLLASAARADELATAGRDIFTKHQHSVVTVQVVLKMSSAAAPEKTAAT